MKGLEQGSISLEQRPDTDIKRPTDLKPPTLIGESTESHREPPRLIDESIFSDAPRKDDTKQDPRFSDINGEKISPTDIRCDGPIFASSSVEIVIIRKDILPNKAAGLERERTVEEELKKKYPESEGYTVLSEQYLRDENGNIVKDPVTGEARRIDFVVIDKDGNVVDSVEVTSKTADKTEQTAKENRIRENGGNYVKGPDGQLHRIPDDLHTRIERRD